MSLRAPRCVKHPSHMLVGVCAFCLRERLAGLADVECASDAATTHTQSRKKKKNLSPGHALAAHGLHSKPSGNRGINAATQVPSVANNVFDEPIASKSSVAPFTSVAHAHSLALAITGSDKPVIVSSVTHAHRNVLACAKKALVEPISSPKDSPKPNKFRGSDIGNGTARDERMRSLEIPAGRPSFSSAKRLSLSSMESNKLPPVDIKMPILENNQHTPMEAKSIKLGQKHASIECTSPLVGIDAQAKVVPAENKMLCATLIDSERSSFNALHGARGCLVPSEPRIETDMSVKDAEILLSNVSSNPGHSKKTLSSLFSLDDAEFSATKVKTDSVNVKVDAMFNGSSSAPVQNVLQPRMSQRKCRHGSFSERVEPSAYLFPVPETGNSKPLSWFSSLFRRRKKKTHPKSVEALASFSEHNNGWDDARQSWEAPRPSSWEQFRFSSFEGPRSSWEPARPSWEGVMRTSDGESVFSGFDFFRESLVEVREDAGFERKNLQDFAGDLANGPDARRSIDSKKAGLKSKSSVLKTPHMDDKDRARTFLSAKPMLMQRDVSTQTTPPRSSDATEIFIQQRLQHDHHRRRLYAKASHAVWSKVWTKTFSNSKWAFKHKHHKERRQKEVGDAVVASDEVHDQGNTTSGRSSFHEGTNVESSHHLKLTHFDDIKEHEAWDTFYSPLQQGRDGGNAVSRLVSKGDGCMAKDEHVDKIRGSNITLENGLLKFYLTPVRGNGIRGKTKQGIRGL